MKFLGLPLQFVLIVSLQSVSAQNNNSIDTTTNPLPTEEFIFGSRNEIHTEFPGGDEALLNFIRENIIYPAEAKQKSEQGKVYVKFVVEEDGSITNVEIARGVYDYFDEEALRIISLMPTWIPGKVNGKTTRMNVVLPIVFKLN